MYPTFRVVPILVVGALLVGTASVQAQVPTSLRERLAAIYERNEFSAESLGVTAWLDGGRRYTRLIGGPEPEIVAYDSATGQSETLVDAKALTPAGAASPLSVSSYAWSADLSKLLLFTNTRRVWRQNTRGDYWVLDRSARILRKLGDGAPEASLMFAKFSPDGTRVAYVRANNIHVEQISSGAITQLTHDGGDEIVNGTADWVNEEELSIRDGFTWSPDGRRIAYWQFNTTGVGRFTLINNTDSLYPRLTTFPFPKAGTRNSAVRLGVVAITGGATTWVRAPGDPREHYIVRMQFIDANTVAFLMATRAQTENRLMLAAAHTGEVREAYRERAGSWLDSVMSWSRTEATPLWFDDNRQFTWFSDKDGWSRVYAIGRDTKQERVLTQLPGDAIATVGLGRQDDRLYFIASPDNATQRYLYSAPLTGSGAPTRVTPADLPGTHSYEMSPDGRWAFHTYSTANMPPRIELVSLPDHRVVRTLIHNQPLAEELRRAAVPPVEFVQVSISPEITMDGYVVKPQAFDPARKYPVITFIYGEVAGVTVVDRWLGNTLMFQRALADAGYLVVSFDNPGTPSPKGAKWRKSAYKAVNHFAAAHQAAALRALAAQRPYLDLDRVGIYGASGGGSNTLNALFREPDVFKVGVAMAPMSDQRLYDTIYQERYSGLPDIDRESYVKSSAINFAEGLRGHLLLMHGTGDDNVHVQSTEVLVNRLVELGKPFDLMLYPNRTHALSEGPGTIVHRWTTVAEYFLRHLPPSESR